ncbi:hypothetical protein E0494_03430 [Marinilabiliaceae bacterium JC040]|nr:hypothetical protein [Marinilabiliaceae bacterium JC040]
MRKILICVFLFSSLLTMGQEFKGEKKIKIVSDFKTKLYKGKKIQLNPKIIDTVSIKPHFNYNLNVRNKLFKFNLLAGEYPKYEYSKDVVNRNFYGNLSFGNYLNLVCDLAYNNHSTKTINWGALFHSHNASGKLELNSVDRDFSFLNQIFNAYFIKNDDDKTIKANIFYTRDSYKYYGGKVYKDLDPFKNNLFSLDFMYAGRISENGIMNTKVDYNLFDYEFTKETVFKINLKNSLDFKWDDLAFNLETNLSYLNSKKLSSYSNISMEPQLRYNAGVFHANLGFGINKFLGDRDNFNIYPKSMVAIDLLDDQFTVFAEIDGGVFNNSYLDIYKINPYLQLSQDKLTVRKYDASFGARGNIDNIFWYKTGVNFKKVDNFLSLYSKENYFSERYSKQDIMTLFLKIGCKWNKNLDMKGDFKFYSYSDEKITNIPSFESMINISYKVGKKWNFNSDIIILGERKVVKTIKPLFVTDNKPLILDLNIGANYKLNKHFNMYLNVENLLNKSYQRWNNYPVMGIKAIIGLTCSF